MYIYKDIQRYTRFFSKYHAAARSPCPARPRGVRVDPWPAPLGRAGQAGPAAALYFVFCIQEICVNTYTGREPEAYVFPFPFICRSLYVHWYPHVSILCLPYESVHVCMV